jgi:hypothetical protein
MNNPKTLTCAICGETRRGSQPWFLVIEDRWQDKLLVLHWDDHIADQNSARCTCKAEHLRELVVHWMTTGSLDHPFAQTPEDAQVPQRELRVSWTARDGSENRGPRPIGELRVHRESMRRVLSENPQSLQTILDALLDGLRRESVHSEPSLNWAHERLRPVPREI